LWGFVLLLVLASWGATQAAEKEKSDKEKGREAEAAAEEQLDGDDSRRNPLLRGKVIMFTAANPDDPAIIGLFITTDKRRFKLEVAREELKAQIRKLSKKEMTLSGKIRDEGTTFIADGIEGGGPPPGLVRNPDGI
jgi:hypothetical protein